MLINKQKRIHHQVDFWRGGEPQNKNKRKLKDRQILGTFPRTKNSVELGSQSDTNCNWNTWNGSKKTWKKPGGIGNLRKNQDHLDRSIDDIGKNTQKSLRDLKWLAVAQTVVQVNLQG